MPFVSNEWIPAPVKSMAVTLKPPSSKSAIVLYQHQAPKPPPWTRTKWLVSRSGSFSSCQGQKQLGSKQNSATYKSNSKWWSGQFMILEPICMVSTNHQFTRFYSISITDQEVKEQMLLFPPPQARPLIRQSRTNTLLPKLFLWHQ